LLTILTVLTVLTQSGRADGVATTLIGGARQLLLVIIQSR
jgi:hypothetical protein